MLNIAILDDDKNICNEVENILEEYLKKNYIKYKIDIFYNGEEFIKYLKNENNYDILFLDIEIGNLTGVDVGKYIRKIVNNRYIKIIYISSFTQYAMDLFELEPTNFLIKPIESEKIIENLIKVLDLINIEKNDFIFKTKTNVYKIPLKDIIYFESVKGTKNIKIKTTEMDKEFKSTISEIEQKLFEDIFIKVNKSIIVNFNYIKCFKPKELILVLHNNEEIKISRLKLKDIKEKYNLYFR